MVETVEHEALRWWNGVRSERNLPLHDGSWWKALSAIEALCRVIKERRAMEAEHQAFREKVSEALRMYFGHRIKDVAEGFLGEFILPPPVDPLVEAFPAVSALIRYHESGGHEGDGGEDTLRKAKDELRSELAKHGLKIERTEA